VFQVAIAQRRLRDTMNVDFVWQWNPRVQKQESNIIRIDIQE
jgi:hypothetical protein